MTTEEEYPDTPYRAGMRKQADDLITALEEYMNEFRLYPFERDVVRETIKIVQKSHREYL